MELIWGRYSGLFYTGAGVIFFIGFGLLFGHFWFWLAAVFLFLFIVGISDYSQKRIIDKNLLVQATHRLNNFFSNDSLLFSKFRNFGLKVFNKSLFLKKQSMLFAMGLKNFNL